MMANAITGLRILVTAVLLFCPAFSPSFYALYLIAGLSDMADGIIARKTMFEVNLTLADYIYNKPTIETGRQIRSFDDHGY